MPPPQALACLDDEVVGAFITGAIAGQAREQVEAHLANCSMCCSLVAAAAQGLAGSTDSVSVIGHHAEDDAFWSLAKRDQWFSTQPASDSRAPAPGDVLANKYRVEQLLGRGGMGDVVAAVHIELGQRVAIKVLRQVDPTTSARFLREAQTCARLTNAHIPRIFDLGRLPNGAPYIVMECLEGEDLAKTIARGPMALADAVGYLLQACEALGEAHAAGVVHRDLKPSNLFLTSRKGGRGSIKVLDFGISKLLGQPGEAALELTSTGAVLGSPLYMSPEQIRAQKDVDALTDIWSLGVILYEMLTGRTPFHATTISALAVAIVTDAPKAPSAIRPTVPVGLEQVVLRCLAKSRLDRFQSVEALEQALTPFAAPEPTLLPGQGQGVDGATGVARSTVSGLDGRAPSRGRRVRAFLRRNWVPSIALCCLCIAAGSYAARYRDAAPAASRSAGRRSVVVIGLRNTSGRPADAWLGTALTELLRTELASGDLLRVLSPERVATLKRDIELGESDSLERSTLGRIHEMVDADIALVGSYWRLEGSDDLRIDTTLQDTRSGETLASIAEHGPSAELFAIVSRTGERLRKKLGAEALSATQVALVKRTQPTDPDAARWYAEGLASLNRVDHLAAIDAFERVVEREPNFPLAHSTLSEAWAFLNHADTAAQEAREALALSAELPKRERLLVEARAYSRTARPDKAMEIYRSLFTVFSDDPDFGLALAQQQVSAGQGAEALATVAELRSLGPPAADDPRLDMAEAYALQVSSERSKEVLVARRAFQKARALGMRSIQAEARLAEGQAYVPMGQNAEARAAFIEARELFDGIHDAGGVAFALMHLGQLEAVSASDDSELAGQHLTEAARIFERIGDQESSGWVYNAMGFAHAQYGSFDAAEADYRRALQALTATASRRGMATAQGNLALALSQRGAYADAAQLFAEAVQNAKQVGDLMLEGGYLAGWAALSVSLGQLDDANGRARAALAVSQQANHLQNTATARVGVAQLQRLAGDLASSRAALAQAVEDVRAAPYPELLDEISLLRMTLDLDSGQPDRVLIEWSEWSKLFGTSPRPGAQARAHSRFALAFLAQNQPSEASRETREALRLVKDSEDVVAVAEATLSDARVRAASEDQAAALAALRAAIPVATRAGRPLEYEARLALADREKASRIPGWQERGQELLEQASKEHFVLYAGRAKALLR